METHENSNPADRPLEPDHPMVVEGQVTPGNTRFMVQCLVEELLMAGNPPGAIRSMAADPNFQALYAAREALGERPFNEIVTSAAARVGVSQATVRFGGDENPDLPNFHILSRGPIQGGE